MILIGSHAARHWFPIFREPNDFDLAATEEELSLFTEHHPFWNGNNHYVWATITNGDKSVKFQVEVIGRTESSKLIVGSSQTLSINGLEVQVAPPEMLMAIKAGQLFYSIKKGWEKAVFDYNWFKDRGVMLTERTSEFVRLRREEYSSKIRVNLDVPNSDFFGKFDKAIGRKFEHDDLHRATCYYDSPLFETVKYDLSKARIEKELFDCLAFCDKIRLAQEEGFAIALERYIIPGKTEDPDFAFRLALKKLVTRLTSGWFRQFIVDNYVDITNLRGYDYVKQFEERIQKVA